MKNYKKYYSLQAPPEWVYRALVFAPTIQLWTGAPVEMTEEVGAEFSLFGGSIVGKNLAFEENKLIQQEWYFGDQEEPSIVTIKLHEDRKGTSVELLHTNIPDEDFENISMGWDFEYFGALVDFYTE